MAVIQYKNLHWCFFPSMSKHSCTDSLFIMWSRLWFKTTFSLATLVRINSANKMFKNKENSCSLYFMLFQIERLSRVWNKTDSTGVVHYNMSSNWRLKLILNVQAVFSASEDIGCTGKKLK